MMVYAPMDNRLQRTTMGRKEDHRNASSLYMGTNPHTLSIRNDPINRATHLTDGHQVIAQMSGIDIAVRIEMAVSRYHDNVSALLQKKYTLLSQLDHVSTAVNNDLVSKSEYLEDFYCIDRPLLYFREMLLLIHLHIVLMAERNLKENP